MMRSVSPSELRKPSTAAQHANTLTFPVAAAKPRPEKHQSSAGCKNHNMQIGVILVCSGIIRAEQRRGSKTANALWFCLTPDPMALREQEAIVLVTPGAPLTLTLSVPHVVIERYAPYFKEFLGQENDGGDPGINDLIYRYIDEFLAQNLRSLDAGNDPAVRCIEDHIAQMIISSLETQSAAMVSNLSKSRLRLRVKDFINRNLEDPSLTPQKIAEACGISLSYLHKIFHITDTSVCRWILQQRLNLSKQRLSDPAYMGVPISRIAYDIGFNNQAHFSSKFKRQFGISPKEVRSRLQAEK